MSDYRDIVKAALEDGFFLDSCGTDERYYDFGSFIDLCGMSVEDVMSVCGGGESTSKTKNVITIKASDTNEVLFSLSYAPTSDVIVKLSVDGTEYTETVPAGTQTFNTGIKLSSKYGTISGITITTSDEVYKYSYSNTIKTGIFTLTYKVDGKVYHTESVKCGDTITAIEAPTKEGYTFSGWSEIPTTMPENDLVITGTFTIKTFTITFVDYDGSVLSTIENVKYGVVPVYDKSKPTRESDNYSVYTFNGWTPTIVAATDNATYTASYTESTRLYTVRFLDDDNTVLSTNKYAYNDTPTEYRESPSGPPVTKEPTEKYKFEFEKWDKEIVPVTSDTDYKAIYTETKQQYTLAYETIKDDVTTVLTSHTFEWGTKIVSQDEPKEETGYKFLGWENEPSIMPTNDVTVTGKYEAIKFDIEFVNDDGNILQSSSVKYGEMPVFTGATPTKESTAEYSYTFSGWTPAITEAYSSATYTASYDETPVDYTLTYKIDDVEYSSLTYAYGETITPLASPEEKEGYTFSGWDNEPTTMPASNYTVTSKWNINTYSVKYIINKLDGTVDTIETSVTYNTSVTFPEVEIVEGYTFNWDSNQPLVITSDTTVNGKYDVNSYSLKVIVDGTEIINKDVAYGTELNSIIPEQAEKVGYTFSWDDWKPETTPTMPASDLTINGSYKINSYKLSFVLDGVETSSMTEYNTTIVYPDTNKEGYTFDGWDHSDTTMPASDLTITGTYTINKHNIIYNVDDEEYKKITDVVYGTAITAEAEPTKDYCTFSGWSSIPTTMPDEDVIVNGTFTPIVYTINFIIEGSTTALTGTYLDDVVAPAHEDRDGYTFKWDKEVPEKFTENIEINGTYTEITESKTIYYGMIPTSSVTSFSDASTLSNVEFTSGTKLDATFVVPSSSEYSYAEDNYEEDEFDAWCQEHMYSYYLLVPVTSSLESFENGAGIDVKSGLSIISNALNIDGAYYNAYHMQGTSQISTDFSLPMHITIK